MAINKQRQIEQNIVLCDNLLEILKNLQDSKINLAQANIYLMIHRLESEVIDLKELCKQIIT